jgi:hypothetical protein
VADEEPLRKMVEGRDTENEEGISEEDRTS